MLNCCCFIGCYHCISHGLCRPAYILQFLSVPGRVVAVVAVAFAGIGDGGDGVERG